MDEKQIRALEIEAAKAMGWTNFRDSEVSRGSILKPRLTADPPPGEDCEIGFDNQPVVPRYARDAEAILSALEWLCGNVDRREHMSGIALWCSPTAKAAGYRNEYLIRQGNDPGYPIVDGETLGIVVCRAIIAKKRNTDQSPPSQDTGREE